MEEINEAQQQVDKKKVFVGFFLTKELKAKLDALAKVRNKAYSKILREYIEREEV